MFPSGEMSLSHIGIVFARGGSKGLPGKNIKPLRGMPLISYSIRTAHECPSIEDIYVSTDDPEIAEIGLREGAKIIKRPLELATDASAEILSWKHAIDVLEAKGIQFDKLVSLPATSPLRSVMDVENAILKHESLQADLCVAVTESQRNPYFNMVVMDSDGGVQLLIPGAEVTRRQDAPLAYDLTTVVYVASVTYLKRCSSLFEGKVVAVEVPKERSVDIDDIYDFRIAEALLVEWK